MNLSPKIFKAYDIRGLYPGDINEENLVQITKAICIFFKQKLNKEKPSIILSCDMRLSSPSLVEVAKKTITEMGCDVIYIGVSSTPTFYYAAANYGYDAGIQITASHNPKDYNGLKFVLNTPDGLLKIGKSTGMEDIKTMAVDGLPEYTVKEPGTITERSGVVEEEVQNAIKLLDNPQIKEFKIVADAANAMGATYIEELFKHVPGKLVKMNFELDGSFPVHQADPMQPENLVDIKKRIIEEGADLGLAPDGDGDRLFILDERGEVVSPSIITSIIAKELLKKYPGGKVVVDLKYTLTPKINVEENGGELLISKTGHAFITELMTKEKALMAGEASAHYYYKFTGNAENQAITIIALLKILTEENKKLSEVAKEFQRSFESGEINYAVANAKDLIQMLSEKYKDGEISDLDGVAITFPTKRISLRSSNTEPLLRLNVEALTNEEMEQTRDEVQAFINEHKVAGEEPSH